MNDDRDGKADGYHFASIEARWQKYWESHGTFRTPNPGDPKSKLDAPKFYILDMFPYPSGAGLHVGHPLGYCATDIVARYKRMRGYNVLHPMGFDSFGLPAEQYAIETGVHPAVTTRSNIDRYRAQLKMFGFSYDWDRELATSDPEFFKFTQWMFTRMFESWYDDRCRWVGPDGTQVIGRARPIAELVQALEREEILVQPDGSLVRDRSSPGARSYPSLSRNEQRAVINAQRLAYLDEIPVNWCPALGTVLANEEVDNEGRSERGGHPVFRRPLKQWLLRITRYAERLLADLDDLDWPEPIKLMQRNWIGRSTGAEVVFPLAADWEMVEGRWRCRHECRSLQGNPTPAHFPHAVRVYTTRPDTLFGATYLVVAPEHPLVTKITTADRRVAVERYVSEASHRSDLDRTADTREKTGVFTGAWAINPVNGRRIPVWVADYVLMGYGTGAIMGVPGSDDRDFDFARRFELPIVSVVRPTTDWIDHRLNFMLGNLSATAASGFDDVLQEFPELHAEVASHKAKVGDLGSRTLATLRERVGYDHLIEHYIRNASSWGAAFTAPGVAVHSPATEDRTASVPGGVCELNDLPTEQAKQKIIRWLEESGIGRGQVQFKLRDWVFSRQKYWGEPIPVLHADDGEVIALDDSELPLELPEMENFQPTPSRADDPGGMIPTPPLGRAEEWVVVRQEGRSFRRDLNTMPQWAGSCWYYLRFIDPGNADRFVDPVAERYWMPVDLYLGGAEHAVLHLLYARFWHKVLYDLGWLSTAEPFQKLFNQGMIQGFAFRDRRGLIAGPDQVVERGESEYAHRTSGEPLTRVVAKMSKSLKNVVNPDEIIAEYGADTFRLYEMYMGPLDAAKPWNTRDVPGLFKLCQRIWRLVVNEQEGGLAAALTDDRPTDGELRILHKTIKRVTDDLEQLKFNTAIAALFDFVNVMTPLEHRSEAVMEPFVLLLAPFTPHLAEELWARLGHRDTLAYEPWPVYDEQRVRDEEVEVAVQVGGKVRARLTVPVDIGEDDLRRAALSDARVVSALEGRGVRKVVVVKGRLVNVVPE